MNTGGAAAAAAEAVPRDPGEDLRRVHSLLDAVDMSMRPFGFRGNVDDEFKAQWKVDAIESLRHYTEEPFQSDLDDILESSGPIDASVKDFRSVLNRLCDLGKRLGTQQERNAAQQERDAALHRLNLAYVLISTSMSDKEKGRVIVLEQQTSTATDFEALFAGCGLQVTAVACSTWPMEPVNDSEASLQAAVENLLGVHITSTSLTLLSHATKPMMFCEDKPDFVLVSTALVNKSGIRQRGQPKCSWPMVSFVGELKPHVFARATALSAAGHTYVDSGLEAVGQLANRAQRFHHDETFYGLVMDKDRVQFWRCDANTRNWWRWPAAGVEIFDGAPGRRGVDFLAAVFRGDAARLRPQGKIPELTAALENIRMVHHSSVDLTVMPIVPMCGLRDDHALLVQVVALGTPIVLKLWKDDGTVFQLTRELNAMRLLNYNHLQVEGNGWRGLEMSFLGPVTLHDLVHYIDRKISPRVDLWKRMIDAVRQIARTLLRLHSSFIHCDIKPRNIVVQIRDRAVTAQLIDFEHTVAIGSIMPGYTTRYCAKYVLNHVLDRAPIPAWRWQDWEALFYSMLSLIVHEDGEERFVAMADPARYWSQIRAPASDAGADRGRRLLFGMKHLTETEQEEAVRFMSTFAEQFQRGSTMDSVPTESEDLDLELRMRKFWTADSV